VFSFASEVVIVRDIHSQGGGEEIWASGLFCFFFFVVPPGLLYTAASLSGTRGPAPLYFPGHGAREPKRQLVFCSLSANST